MVLCGGGNLQVWPKAMIDNGSATTKLPHAFAGIQTQTSNWTRYCPYTVSDSKVLN